MEALEGFKKLSEHYKGCIRPGLIIGDAQAIVGPYGVEIITFISATERFSKRFIEGEGIPIIQFEEKLLLVDVGLLSPLKLPYGKFKGFRFKNKLFVGSNLN